MAVNHELREATASLPCHSNSVPLCRTQMIDSNQGAARSLILGFYDAVLLAVDAIDCVLRNA
jgi:hypothetical protein